MIGGRSLRTYVSGERRLASSSRLGRLPNHSIVYARGFFPVSSMSLRSVIPYQLTIAATLGSGGPPPLVKLRPGHWRSRPAEGGIIPVVSARCPPADSPVITI